MSETRVNEQRLLKVLAEPHVSEKGALLADNHRQIVFKVARDATKPEIKGAVEMMFNVKVKAVSVLNVKGKTKRFGRLSGRRSDWKKAYVTLQDGYDIDFHGTGASSE